MCWISNVMSIGGQDDCDSVTAEEITIEGQNFTEWTETKGTAVTGRWEEEQKLKEGEK